MQFLVLGVDGPEFDGDLETDLHERHWAYMDRWAHALVARGPLLTPDGETHAGSLHVVDLADLGAATRFALDEPYARAGWYAQVTVHPLDPCVAGTMWDRPRPQAGRPSSFVRASYDARPRDGAGPSPDSTLAWLYLGFLLTDDARAAIGLVGLADLTPDEAVARLSEAAEALGVVPVELSGQRWQRGGRHQT